MNMDKNIFEDLTNKNGIQETIDKFHKLYNQRIDYYEMKGKELSRFAWASGKTVSLYIVVVFSDYYSSGNAKLLFAVPNQTGNKVFYADFVNKTANYTFGSINDAKVSEKLSWMVSQDLLSNEFAKSIHPSSLSFSYFDFKNHSFQDDLLEKWARDWVDNEYSNTSNELQRQGTIEPFPLSKQQFFIDRYHFDEMLKTLNDDQFTDEFNQCLFAYENKKWFICAAGLGSCLEHLMEKIIINYNKKGYKTLRNLSKDPTFKDYLATFRKPPINMEPRQETYIRMLSMARNSVDHHNTGYTKKNICDSLLDGIRNVFNDYYSSSVLIKNAPKDEK